MSATNHPTRERGAGVAAVVVGLTAFSWGFILFKVIHLPTSSLAMWRLVIGSTVLGAVALALRVPWPRERLPTLIAGVAFGGHQLLLISAVQQTSIAIVTLVAATQPLLVALVAQRAVGERVPRAMFGFAALAISGVVVVVWANVDDASRSVTGDLLAVANVLVITVNFVAAKRARTGGAPTLTFTASMLMIALVVVAPVALVAGVHTPDDQQLGLLVVLALGPGSGHLLVNWAHTRVPVALSALILAALPLLSSLWAHLVLDEPYTWRHVVGMVLVVIAIDGGRRAVARAARSATPEA